MGDDGNVALTGIRVLPRSESGAEAAATGTEVGAQTVPLLRGQLIGPGSEGRAALMGRELILVSVFVKPGAPAGGGACWPRRRNGVLDVPPACLRFSRLSSPREHAR